MPVGTGNCPSTGHAGLDRINPGSVILSGVMMLEFLGWRVAADLVTKGLSAAIADKQVT